MDKISVVIAAFNAEEYIEIAITSILKQTVPVNEVIVVNDGSKDRTKDVVEELIEKSPSIKIVNLEKNAGVSNARNAGMKVASGDWILFFDADDECEQTLVEMYVSLLEKKQEYHNIGMIYTAYQQIDKNSVPFSKPLRGKMLEKSDGFCEIMMRNPIISPSGVLVKQEALKEGFNVHLSFNEDVDLWLRIVNKFIIEYIDEPLSFIRRHTNNTTSSMSISHNAEKLILNQYGLDYIKEKLFDRNLPLEKNSIDYALLLLRYEEYEQCYNLLKNIKIEEDSSLYISLCFMRSVYFIHIKDLEQAMKQYEIILNIDKGHGASLNNAGVISIIKGLHEQAFSYWQKALMLFPGYLDAKHNLELANNGNVDADLYRFTLRELRPVLLTYSTD